MSSNLDLYPVEVTRGITGSKRMGSYLAYSIDTGRSDIGITALLDETGLASEVYQSLLNTGVIFAAAIVVIILLMVTVSYGVGSEFKTLINSMNQTTVLNRSAKLPVQANDEVGQLTEVSDHFRGLRQLGHRGTGHPYAEYFGQQGRQRPEL